MAPTFVPVAQVPEAAEISFTTAIAAAARSGEAWRWALQILGAMWVPWSQ